MTWGALRGPDNAETLYPLEGLNVPAPVPSQESVSPELEDPRKNDPAMEDKPMNSEIPDEVDRGNKTSRHRAKSKQKGPQSGTLRGSSTPAELPKDETVEDYIEQIMNSLELLENEMVDLGEAR